jgi:hypothetical protein
MNSFISLIIEVFKKHLMSIFVIQNNKEYTYKFVFEKSIALACYLNNTYHNERTGKDRIRILLIANNSVEWIICFFGILLSRHKLILFSPKAEISSINTVIVNSGITLIISDDSVNLPMFIRKEYEYEDISIVHFFSDEGYLDELPEQQSQLLLFNNKLEATHSDYEGIVQKLITLGRYQIFKDSTIYIGKVEFTYNFILGLLLPFIEGVTIVIPNKEEDIYGVKNMLTQYQPEVVILTARQYKKLHREYIDCPEDGINQILKRFKLWFIRKRLLKDKVKIVFPRLKQLIILNSKLDYHVEKLLKDLKVPFTVTLGEIGDCGIHTYYSPTDYRIGMLSEYYEDNIKSVEGFNVVSSDIDNLFTSSPLVEDTLLIQKPDGNLYLYIKTDNQYIEYLGYNINRVIYLLEKHRQLVNRKVLSIDKIYMVIPLIVDFERDEYGRINKERYKWKD